jgi:hypothetical protein
MKKEENDTEEEKREERKEDEKIKEGETKREENDIEEETKEEGKEKEEFKNVIEMNTRGDSKDIEKEDKRSEDDIKDKTSPSQMRASPPPLLLVEDFKKKNISSNSFFSSLPSFSSFTLLHTLYSSSIILFELSICDCSFYVSSTIREINDVSDISSSPISTTNLNTVPFSPSLPFLQRNRKLSRKRTFDLSDSNPLSEYLTPRKTSNSLTHELSPSRILVESSSLSDSSCFLSQPFSFRMDVVMGLIFCFSVFFLGLF